MRYHVQFIFNASSSLYKKAPKILQNLNLNLTFFYSK